MSKTIRDVFGNSLIQLSLFIFFATLINLLGIPLFFVILTAVLVAPLGIGLYWFVQKQKPAEEQARTNGMTGFFIVIWLLFVVLLAVRWPG